MKKLSKVFIIVLIATVMIFGAIKFGNVAFAGSSNIASGTAGENVNWVIDKSGTLTISGSGEIVVEWYDAPWKAYKDSIFKIDIGEGIIDIPSTALYELENVTEIYIPSTVATISFFAFDTCTGIERFIVADENPIYKSEGGILFSKDGSRIVKYPMAAATEEYTVPSGVTALHDSAFSFTQTLKKLTIGDEVTEIGVEVFYNSTIETIIMGSGIDTIPSSAFSLASIKSFIIPDTVKHIQNSIFYDADYLEMLILGSGIEDIGRSFCAYTRYLDAIHYNGTAEQWANIKIDEENAALFEKEIHFVGYIDGFDASCTDGHTGGFYCSDCDEFLTGEIIPATSPHTTENAVVENTVESDCTTDASYDLVVYCADCEELLSRETIVTADRLGHSWVNSVCSVCEIECEHIDENYDSDCDECKAKNLFLYSRIELDGVGTVTCQDGDTSDEYVIFIPVESGYYEIYSMYDADNNIDPWAEISLNGITIDSSDDYYATGYNFKLIFKAEAGQTYVIHLENLGADVLPYEYYLKKNYSVTSQPTSSSPTVKLSWNAVGEYRWYAYTLGKEITDKNATAVNSYGDGSTYVDGKGWYGDYWDDDEASYFTVRLKAGEAIFLDFGHEISDETGIWDTSMNEGFEVEYDDNISGQFVFVAPFSGNFEVYTYDAESYTYLRAYKISCVTELEEENEATLKNPQIGTVYACDVKINGVFYETEPFMYDYAIVHFPTADAPYVEVNEGDAEYQWNKLLYNGEVTGDGASSVNWGNGETSYIDGEGWNGVKELYDTPNCYDFFTINLKAKQKITLIFSGDFYSGAGLYDYEKMNGTWEDFNNNNIIELVAEYDGNYTVYSYSQNDTARVRAYVGETEYVAIEEATQSKYFAENTGYYSCEVTYENGATARILTYLTTHEHIDADADYICDECLAELPGKPANDDSTEQENEKGPSSDNGNASTENDKNLSEGNDEVTEEDLSGISPTGKAVIIAASIIIGIGAAGAASWFILKKKGAITKSKE